MAETPQPMSSSAVGNATGSSSKVRRVHGVSDAQGVNQKINQDDFFNDLDSLIGISREQSGCSVGRLVSKLDEPLRSKLNEIMKNEKVNSARLAEVMLAYGLQVSSSDVLRRHRRRLIGKDGCKCSRES
jgi:hypothetical protein